VKLLPIVLALAGTGAAATAGGAVLRARKRKRLAEATANAAHNRGVSMPTVAAHVLAEQQRKAGILQKVVPNYRPTGNEAEHVQNLLGQSAAVANVRDYEEPAAPYRVIDAVSIAQRLICVASACDVTRERPCTDDEVSDAPSDNDEAHTYYAELGCDPNPDLNGWIGQQLTALLASILRTPVGPRSKVRAIIFQIIVPLLACEFYQTADGLEPFDSGKYRFDTVRRRFLRVWAQGSPQKAQLVAGVAAWVALWLIGPDTGEVVREAYRSTSDQFDFVRFQGNPWPLTSNRYLDASRFRASTLDEKRQALEELHSRMRDYMTEFCEAVGPDSHWKPEPCEVIGGRGRGGLITKITDVRSDEGVRYDSPEAIAAGNLRRIELIAELPGIVTQSEAPPPPIDGVLKSFMEGSVAAASTVLSAFGGQAAAAGLASAVNITTQMASLAIGIARSVETGASARAVMQKALGSGLAQALRAQAGLFLDQDFAAAASYLQQQGQQAKAMGSQLGGALGVQF